MGGTSGEAGWLKGQELIRVLMEIECHGVRAGVTGSRRRRFKNGRTKHKDRELVELVE